MSYSVANRWVRYFRAKGLEACVVVWGQISCVVFVNEQILKTAMECEQHDNCI